MAVGVRDSVLVGRVGELRLAGEVLDAVAAGSARAVAVSGEPGIGKSRLLAEIGMMAARRGQLVLAGRAAEFERDLPFGVFVDALDEHLRMLAAEKIQRLGRELQSELALLFPSLSGGAAEDAVGSPHHERYRAHRAVRDLLERLAAGAPLVLLLDDVHWADGASVELLSALLRRPPAAGVLLAVSLRPRQADGLLGGVLEHAVRERLVVRLELQTLAYEEATSLLSSSLAPGLWDAVYAQAGGNPLYLQELAHTANSSGGALSAAVGEDGAVDGGGVPSAVTVALTQELREPIGDARELLRGAAVAGDPFDLDLAGAAAGMSEDAAFAAVDELLARDLVRSTDTPRRFRFRHPLLRRATYDATPTGWRLRAHERTASALAARGGSATARAHHVEQSARVGDLDAVALLSDAGAAALQRAPASAARWFSAALRLLPEQGVAPEQRIDLLIALADALAAIGRLEDSRAILLQLLDLAPDDAWQLRSGVIGACASIEHLLGRHRDAHDRLQAALSTLSDHRSPAAVALLTELAVGHFYDADYDGMRDRGKSALTAASALHEQPAIAAATAVVAAACAFAGEIADGRAYADDCARLVEGVADSELSTRTLCYLAWAELFLERFEDCLAYTARGIALARTSGNGQFLSQLMQAHAGAMLHLGRLVEAVDTGERAIEAARLSANPHSIVWALMNCAHASLARDAHAALRLAEESVQMTRGLERSAIFTMAEAVHAAALGDVGEHARCAEMLLQAGGGIGLIWLPVGWRPFFLEYLARAQLACGRIPDAAHAAQQAEALANRLQTGLSASRTQRTRAAVLLAQQHPQDAAATALAAAHSAISIGARVEEARARALAGRALLSAGQRDQAIAELHAAAGLFESCGATWLGEHAERELRRLGRPYRHSQPTTTTPGALTARELEIATLVSARKTNREIAGELFLSEKTVETHLRNIFAKLGVSSRRAIAHKLP